MNPEAVFLVRLGTSYGLSSHCKKWKFEYLFLDYVRTVIACLRKELLFELFKYRFPYMFARDTILKKNHKPQITKPAYFELILAQNSRFPSLFAVFLFANRQNRE